MEVKNYYPNKVWGLAINISVACYIYCFSISAMNSCTDNIGMTLSWHDSYLMKSIFTTLFPVGCLVGTVIGAPLSKKYGRRQLIIICNIVFIITSLVTIVPTNYTFGIGRFVTGIIGGVFITVPAVFINEITPDPMAGKVGTLVQQACNLAFISSYGFGLLAPTEDLENNPWNYIWMLIIFFPAFCSFYQLFYFATVFKFESPAWLISQNRLEEAREALRFVYSEEGVEIGLKRLSGESKETNSINENLLGGFVQSSPTYAEIFCSKAYRKMLRITLGLNIGQQTSGSMVIFLYSTTIFEDMGGGKFIARVLTVGVGLINMISGLAALPLIERLGRKTLLLLGQVLICADLASLGLLTGYISVDISLRAVFIYLYFFVFSFSLGVTFWAYIGEVCNDKCISIGLTMNLLTVVVLSFAFPVAQNFLGISACFFIFCGLSVALFLYQIADLFETKGLSKLEIQAKVLKVN